MSKLKKCLYLIDLLSRRGPMSLKEINENNQYSPIYDGEIILAHLQGIRVVGTGTLVHSFGSMN